MSAQALHRDALNLGPCHLFRATACLAKTISKISRWKKAACFIASHGVTRLRGVSWLKAQADFNARLFVQPLRSICGHCLTSRKACKQVYGFGVEFEATSSLTLRGRPPFFPACAAIWRRRSGESFRARALPPIRANSVIVSFFIRAMYHERRPSTSSVR
jgi:hypothetical protein